MKKFILAMLSALVGAVTAGAVLRKILGKRIEEKQSMSDKHLTLFLMMNQWVKVKQEGKKLATYFEREGYRKIAVYGMSYAGESFINEIKDSQIKILYGIDKNFDRMYSDIPIVSEEGVLEPVDAIVVTAVTFFEEIEKNLNSKVDCPIVSLEDILYDVQRNG